MDCGGNIHNGEERDEEQNCQLFFAGLASALRRASTFFETRSRRLRAVFDPVATFSMAANSSGLSIFWRISFRKGCTLAKMKNISPLTPGSIKNSSLSAPWRTMDAAIFQ